MLRVYTCTDPKTDPQKVITPMLLTYLYTREKDDIFAQHIADLCNRAFFFCVSFVQVFIDKGHGKDKDRHTW